MTLLADEFTLVLLFSSQDPQAEEVLLKECRRLEKEKGVSAFMRPLDERGEQKKGGSLNYTLHRITSYNVCYTKLLRGHPIIRI